jgi:hypothetical protein
MAILAVSPPAKAVVLLMEQGDLALRFFWDLSGGSGYGGCNSAA